MTGVCRNLCVAAAALLVSAGSAIAQDATKPDPRAENRRERVALGILPDLRRSNDKLIDRAEEARARHALEKRRFGHTELLLTARLGRVDTTESLAVSRTKHEGAIQDARIARVLGKRNDRREREEHTALELALQLQKLKFQQFDRSHSGFAKTKEDERYEREHQKREEGKKEVRSPLKDRVLDDSVERAFERDESMRARAEERAAAKAEREAEKKDDKADKKAEKDADKADKKADKDAEKKLEKADALKDRADDRKDVRSDAKIESDSDRKTP